MGITIPAAKFFVQARAQGVSFEKTLTLGHQDLYTSPQVLEKLLKQYNSLPIDYNQAAFYAACTQPPVYVDPFLKLLGAKQIASMDISDYQGSDIIHDLNNPIPPHLRETFDVVFDGGALEHVFNFPLAIKNCMEMVKPGGHFPIFCVANNFFGHGFYQFSPDLFFRVLSEENGFNVERMIVLEDIFGFSKFPGYHEYLFSDSGPWYEVLDPKNLQGRGHLINKRPTVLLIQAKRTNVVPIFSQHPQQSDYVATWSGEIGEQSQPTEVPASPIKRLLKQVVQPATRRHLRIDVIPRLIGMIDPFRYQRYVRLNSFHNRRFFKPVKD